jgi:hypothetical protein
MARAALALALTMTFASGCANAVSDSAICDATAQSRSAHAAALAADGGPLSLRSGEILIAQVDAGCARF